MISERDLEKIEGSINLEFERGPYPLQDGACQRKLSFADAAEIIDNLFLARRIPRKRRLEYVCGRLCARRGLIDLGTSHLRIAVAPSRAPIWPIGVVGSISHTDTFAAAAVASRGRLRSLGIDSERIVTRDVAAVILSECLREAEKAYLSEADPNGVETICTLLFSAKETVFKALCPLTGSVLDLQDIEIFDVVRDARSFRARVANDSGDPSDIALNGIGRYRVSPPYVHTSFLIYPPVPHKPVDLLKGSASRFRP
jgi:4'-phosphopantetheinyl transferase EntD